MSLFLDVDSMRIGAMKLVPLEAPQPHRGT